MLTVELQKLNRDLERICADSLARQEVDSKGIERYLAIRKSYDPYSFKHSLWLRGACTFPCNQNCNPREENEIFVSKEIAEILSASDKTQEKAYTDMGDSFNNICFSRCGFCKEYPKCDKNGAIDVRLLGNSYEVDSYVQLRPDSLLRRDADIHPENMEMFRALHTVFELEGKPETVKKIDSVL